jgi:hypothetical protein
MNAFSEGALILLGKFRKSKKIIIKSGGNSVFLKPRKRFSLCDLNAPWTSSSLPKPPSPPHTHLHAPSERLSPLSNQSTSTPLWYELNLHSHW